MTPHYARRGASDRRGVAALVDAAAATLTANSRAFTSKNLFHAARRVAASRAERFELGYQRFRDGLLAARLRAGPVPGLLPDATDLGRGARLPREWRAYFPACILLVDRPQLIPLFAASGVLVQARLAVVSLDGQPEAVLAWLCRGLRDGHRAPVGYLHDAGTVVYPFTSELLATWLHVRGRREEIAYRDLGLPPMGSPSELFGVAGEAVREVEEPPPHAMIAHVARALLAMIPPDPMLFPLGPRRRVPSRPEVTNDRRM